MAIIETRQEVSEMNMLLGAEKYAAKLAEELEDEELSRKKEQEFDSSSVIARKLQERWPLMSREKRRWIALKAIRKERNNRGLN